VRGPVPHRRQLTLPEPAYTIRLAVEELGAATTRTCKIAEVAWLITWICTAPPEVVVN
jgi:hypothetical protein